MMMTSSTEKNIHSPSLCSSCSLTEKYYFESAVQGMVFNISKDENPLHMDNSEIISDNPGDEEDGIYDYVMNEEYRQKEQQNEELINHTKSFDCSNDNKESTVPKEDLKISLNQKKLISTQWDEMKPYSTSDHNDGEDISSEIGVDIYNVDGQSRLVCNISTSEETPLSFPLVKAYYCDSSGTGRCSYVSRIPSQDMDNYVAIDNDENKYVLSNSLDKKTVYDQEAQNENSPSINYIKEKSLHRCVSQSAISDCKSSVKLDSHCGYSSSYNPLKIPSSVLSWPMPVPFRLLTSHTTHPALEITSLFKYRINYPFLVQWVQTLLHIYLKWRTGEKIPDNSAIQNARQSVNHFLELVIKKKIYKSKRNYKRLVEVNGDKYNTTDNLHDAEAVPNENLRCSILNLILDGEIENPEIFENQLWKRRYYNLLNAVDFVYKDYQLLHYVCREGLFDYVSCNPNTSSDSNYKWHDGGNVDKNTEKMANHALTGSDPIGYLAYKITQLLLLEKKSKSTGGQNNLNQWPCCLSISVAFLSDIIAQSRILRNDLEHRLAIHDRLVYVLGQARDQRTKLRLHMHKQNEIITELTHKLNLNQQKINQLSAPITGSVDIPSSVRKDNFSSAITSPFIDTEYPPNELMTSDSPKSLYTFNKKDGQQDNDRQKLLELEQKVIELQHQIASFERVLKEEEAYRKRIHNYIQELVGNIRVFCRLRPGNNNTKFKNTTSGYENVKSSFSVQKNYLSVNSNDKLLFCTETIRDYIRKQQQCQQQNQINSSGLFNNLKSIPGVGVNGISPSGVAFLTHTNIPRCFIFDHVFGPEAQQKDIFNEIEDLIISSLDGYNVCIMAYGQTGSGKTYTMMGTKEEPGVNRRAIKHLFDSCYKRRHWKYTITMSMVEIYQEDVYDLLSNDISISVNSNDNGHRENSNERKTDPSVGIISRSITKLNRSNKKLSKSSRPLLPWNTWINTVSTQHSKSRYTLYNQQQSRQRNSVRILTNETDELIFKNLKEHLITSEDEMLYYLEKAEKQRHVGCTQLNISSSRSHLIILLKVHGENHLHNITSHGALTLADLAGSENVTKSGSTGERFLEAACINKSLSSLGRVFDALRRQQKPTYRESKLTYLLKPNLSGDSKCLLLVTLRTEPEHAEETWRAIHFGQSALQVVPGRQRDSRNRHHQHYHYQYQHSHPSNNHHQSINTPSSTNISLHINSGLMSPASLLSSVRAGQNDKLASVKKRRTLLSHSIYSTDLEKRKTWK
uniref:Kinesin motor domain-containing protein n=1 Tax=Trichobilharzia regenti TaxID=157069 RepID=A0AA85JXB5_TRIRE|nr:unnamed protein product [Trichobilharzia regenti]